MSQYKQTCIATANRKRAGGPGPCLQRAIDGTEYCWYHQPGKDRKFGSGYGSGYGSDNTEHRAEREGAKA